MTDETAHLNLDAGANVVLKGHLVIEEKITSVIEKFVFHPECLEDARLTFAQKLSVSRSISLDESENPMWDLIAKLNRLRNALSHSLEGEPRVKAMDALRAAYIREVGRELRDFEKANENVFLIGVLSLCLGFLIGFEEEIERFRTHINLLDRVVNPHRNVEPQ
jgi:hypothetical protein